MITDSVVVDVSQDWAIACDLQERFMEVPYVKTQGSRVRRPLRSDARSGR